jgi:hypothetical protein
MKHLADFLLSFTESIYPVILVVMEIFAFCSLKTKKEFFFSRAEGSESTLKLMEKNIKL